MGETKTLNGIMPYQSKYCMTGETGHSMCCRKHIKENSLPYLKNNSKYIYIYKTSYILYHLNAHTETNSYKQLSGKHQIVFAWEKFRLWF